MRWRTALFAVMATTGLREAEAETLRLICPSAEVSHIVAHRLAAEPTSWPWIRYQAFRIEIDLDARTAWYSGNWLIGFAPRLGFHELSPPRTGRVAERGQSFEIRREERAMIDGQEVIGETLYVNRRTGELGHFLSLPGGRSLSLVRGGDCRLDQDVPNRF